MDSKVDFKIATLEVREMRRWLMALVAVLLATMFLGFGLMGFLIAN